MMELASRMELGKAKMGRPVGSTMLDDPLTDPKVLAERNKARRKRERERERKAAVLEGREPVVELRTPGRPKKQHGPPSPLALPNTGLIAAAPTAVEAAVAISLPDYAVTAASMAAEAERMAAESAAAESAAAEQAATAAAAEAEAEAVIEAAATEAAAAEIEAAIEQVAACAAAEAEAIGAAVEGIVASVEQAEAERLRKAQAEARKIAPDRGFIDEARSRSTARVVDDGIEATCFICMDSHPNAYMPCCRHLVHRACVQRWHAMGQDKTGKHELRAPTEGSGWKPVAMARLHECPHCGSPLLSARVPRI